MEKFNNIQYNKKYTSDINESNYIQKINANKNCNNNTKDKKVKYYNNVEDILIYTYEYKSHLEKMSQLNIDAIKIEIASKIDENSEEYYNKYNYNSRKFNKNLIQRGLQEKNKLSTLLYLCDKYNINLYLINDSIKSKTLLSSNKILNKEDIYIKQINNKYTFGENNQNYSIVNDIKKIKEIDCDIKTKDIYINYLKAISNYKLEELQDIAKNNNIDIKFGNKNKTKKALNKKINIKMV
jgi:hypothetical protein